MSQNNNIIKSNDEHMIYIRLKTNFDKAGLYLIGASNKKGPFFIKKKGQRNLDMSLLNHHAHKRKRNSSEVLNL